MNQPSHVIINVTPAVSSLNQVIYQRKKSNNKCCIYLDKFNNLPILIKIIILLIILILCGILGFIIYALSEFSKIWSL